MLMVNALAGTGKTTTGLWGLGVRVPSGIKVSAEQKAIVEKMRSFKGSLGAMAFNRSIADELKQRVPAGCIAQTANAFGHQAWGKFVGNNCSPDALKNRKLCRELIPHIPWKDRMGLEIAVDDLVSLCKSYMFDPNTINRENWLQGEEYTDGVGSLQWLAARFSLDITPQIIELVQKVYKKGVDMKTYIDYDDQILMPLLYNVPLPKFGHLLGDEVQDWNRAKQELALRMAENLTAIGDRNQSIYAFAGADSDAMDNLLYQMGEDVEELPLNTTRRCPQAVVELARKIVPELKAAPNAPEGTVERNIDYNLFMKQIILDKEPSMIICRVNAPLTSLAFRMIANGKRCYIQGREIGKGLKDEIKKSGENDLRAAMSKVYNKISAKKLEIASRDFPDEAQIEALSDKWTCLETIADRCDTVEDMFKTIDDMFKDYGSPNDTRLSSGHKSKGLEHKRVYIFHHSKLGRPAKHAYQTKQEKNLQYVCYTRSMDYLGLVGDPPKVAFEEE